VPAQHTGGGLACPEIAKTGANGFQNRAFLALGEGLERRSAAGGRQARQQGGKARADFVAAGLRQQTRRGECAKLRGVRFQRFQQLG